jgi:tetratricopeptide (TPR) repeat protein
VYKRFSFLSILVSASLLGVPQPSIGQVFAPHVPELDAERMEQQGLFLAQEAVQLAQFQQFELALQRTLLASQLAPESPQIWLLLGQLYLQMQDFEQALDSVLKARALDEEDPAALFELGSIYLRLGESEKAAESLEQGLEFAPGVPGALFDLGNAYFLLGRYDDAIDRYEQSAEIDETFWPSINNIGLVLYEQGDIDDAVEQWEIAVDITEEQEAEPLLAIAVALYVEGDESEALDVGRMALEMDTRYADLDFLKENLWGDRLLADTEEFLNLPTIQDVLLQSSASSFN